MKRVLTFCILFYLLANTSTVLATEDSSSDGDGEKGKRHGLLLGTLKKTTDSVESIVKETVTSTEKTVKDTVDYTKKTVDVLTSPQERKPVSTIVENTGKLLEKTVENTVPVVSSITDTVTETVSHTTQELNSTIDKLPTIPVVTPVVDEVRGITDQTTTTVVNVVDKTVNSVTKKVPPLPIVEPVVEEVKETVNKTTSAIRPVEKEAVKVLVKQTDEAKSEIAGTEKVDSTDTRVERDLVEERPLETVLPNDDAAEAVPFEPLTELEKSNKPVTGENRVSDKMVTAIEEMNENGFEELQNKVETSTVQPVVEKQLNTPSVNKTNITSQPSSSSPFETEKDWRSETWAIITTGNSSTASPALTIGSNGDTSMAVIFDVFLLSTSAGKQWVHPEDNVMMQWTHAPPGRPPQSTPFLYVNPTY